MVNGFRLGWEPDQATPLGDIVMSASEVILRSASDLKAEAEERKPKTTPIVVEDLTNQLKNIPKCDNANCPCNQPPKDS